MATAELAAGLRRTKRRRPPLRFFFVFMVALSVAILSLAFVPEFIRYAQGAFPIAPIVHVHAAIMGAWILAFVMQVFLGIKGKIVQHQRAGRIAFAIGWLACVSMIFVEWRAMLVHPLPDQLPPYDEFLAGPYLYLTFAIFLAWAFHERRRPMWHKRLMLFAFFLSLGAAVQRYVWLPMTDSPAGYWAVAAFLDVCLLVPLVTFDLVTLRGRLHPATLRGMAVLFLAQTIVLSLWGSLEWREFAYNFSHEFRRLA
jgi:uncharacterized membrane protein YozB (DUF420 family)